jgi:hypothetical protein
LEDETETGFAAYNSSLEILKCPSLRKCPVRRIEDGGRLEEEGGGARTEESGRRKSESA